MKLHYSQTKCREYKNKNKVLLPYEITLFSNTIFDFICKIFVLLPYEITLFSNLAYLASCTQEFYYLMKLHYSQTKRIALLKQKVLLPYEITLFSNTCSGIRYRYMFYYLMKLHYSQTNATS